jgi:hypothetical protein
VFLSTLDEMRKALSSNFNLNFWHFPGGKIATSWLVVGCKPKKCQPTSASYEQHCKPVL